MGASLPPDALTRFAKLLGMLGSEHMGERAAAALKCTELLKAHAMTWADLIGQVNKPTPQPKPQPQQTYRQQKPETYWHFAAKACLEAHEGEEIYPTLSDWEFGFINDILERGFDLSEKQTAVLARICAKMKVEFA